MDLCERTYNMKRHPWELARLSSLKMILKPITRLGDRLRILDIGCGDGFVVLNLFAEITLECIDAVDTKLSEDEIREIAVQEKNINFHNNYDKLKKGVSYNLLMMLDVIELLILYLLTTVNAR